MVVVLLLVLVVVAVAVVVVVASRRLERSEPNNPVAETLRSQRPTWSSLSRGFAIRVVCRAIVAEGLFCIEAQL